MKYRGIEHTKLVNEIMLAIGSQTNFKIWKNATGVARSMDGNRIIKYGLPGSPDIIGICQGGRFVSIEVKTGSGKLSKEQISFRNMITKYEGIYLVVYSVQDALEQIQNMC